MGWGGPWTGASTLGGICPWSVSGEPQATGGGSRGSPPFVQGSASAPLRTGSPGGLAQGLGSHRCHDSRDSSASGAELTGGLEPQPMLQEAWDGGCDGGGGGPPVSSGRWGSRVESEPYPGFFQAPSSGKPLGPSLAWVLSPHLPSCPWGLAPVCKLSEEGAP